MKVGWELSPVGAARFKFANFYEISIVLLNPVNGTANRFPIKPARRSSRQKNVEEIRGTRVHSPATFRLKLPPITTDCLRHRVFPERFSKDLGASSSTDRFERTEGPPRHLSHAGATLPPSPYPLRRVVYFH